MKKLLFLLPLPLVFLAAGCSTSMKRYTKNMDTIHDFYSVGNFEAAIAIVDSQIEVPKQ